MKKILLFGAGRSATHLISYLLEQADLHDWSMTVVDSQVEQALSKLNGHGRGAAVELDIFNDAERQRLIESHDMVISLLPARLHSIVAKDCFKIERHLCTASYVTDEMVKLAADARKKGLIFMGELGLDPGLDHMSALEVMDDIQAKGGKLVSFRSYTGGLVAPESDNNPWHYKISWNPRNVVLAGRGTATYFLGGRLKYIPYHQLFKRAIKVDVQGMGEYDMYANRDSLSYRHIYGIEDVETIIRGTLRHSGYCAAWDALINLGLTSDDEEIDVNREMTYAELLEAHVPAGSGDLKERTANYLKVEVDSDVMHKLNYLELFSDKIIDLEKATPAKILEELIKVKWKLMPEDKDMIIMQHEFGYELDGEEKEIKSTLVMEGDNAIETAMSKLVGLPLAIFVKLIMTDKISEVHAARPIEKKVYQPILEELKTYDVVFKHS